MKVLQREFAKKLAVLKTALPTVASVPALKGVLVKDGHLTAYNLEYGITVEMQEAENCCFVLPPEAIQMIESLPAEELQIDAGKNNVLHIRCAGISHKVNALPPQDYPNMPQISEDGKAQISCDILMEGIESVSYATSNDLTKIVQTGVLFEAKGGQLNLVACDGRRLAWFKTKLKGTFRLVVPREFLQRILNLKAEGSVDITYNSRHAVFSVLGYSLFTRLLEGKFIDYNASIPQNEKVVLLNRRIVLECLHRVGLCSQNVIENANGKAAKTLAPVVFTIDTDEKELHVSIQNHLAQYAEALPLERRPEFDLKVGFNTQYLTECIRHCDSDKIELCLDAATSPAIIRDGDLIGMVLPVRLKNT